MKMVNMREEDKRKFSNDTHKRNNEIFNTIIFLIKVPYYLAIVPIKAYRKITKYDERMKLQAKIKRLEHCRTIEKELNKENNIDSDKYIDDFKKIKFIDKLGMYPILIKHTKEGDKESLVFDSNIALSDWTSKKEALEMAFNTNIINFIQGDSKNRIILETTKKDIPTYIEWHNDYLLDGLDISLGQTALKDVTINLEKYTSGIIAGSVGSGKSVSLMSLVYQLLLKRQFKDIPIEINLFDGKGGLDWYYFEDYLNTFDTEIDNFSKTLDSIYKEYEKRKGLFAKKAQKLSIWNSKFPDKKLPDIFIVIDEISIITDVQGMEKDDKAIRQTITRKLADLARLGRAMGIHIIIGIQVPNMQTVPGQLKNVLDMRISGFLKDESASKIILGNLLASRLKHIKGRMILDTLEYQSYFLDVETETIFNCLDEVSKPDIDTSKTINLEKRKKKSTKNDSNITIEADVDLTSQ